MTSVPYFLFLSPAPLLGYHLSCLDLCFPVWIYTPLFESLVVSRCLYMSVSKAVAFPFSLSWIFVFCFLFELSSSLLPLYMCPCLKYCYCNFCLDYVCLSVLLINFCIYFPASPCLCKPWHNVSYSFYKLNFMIPVVLRVDCFFNKYIYNNFQVVIHDL